MTKLTTTKANMSSRQAKSTRTRDANVKDMPLPETFILIRRKTNNFAVLEVTSKHSSAAWHSTRITENEDFPFLLVPPSGPRILPLRPRLYSRNCEHNKSTNSSKRSPSSSLALEFENLATTPRREKHGLRKENKVIIHMTCLDSNQALYTPVEPQYKGNRLGRRLSFLPPRRRGADIERIGHLPSNIMLPVL
jgi:hypothetical protein